MEHEEQKSSSNPSTMLNALLCKRAKLHDDLRILEKQTTYLQDPSQCGNVLKGFEGFLSSSKSTTLLKRSRKLGPEDRLFSLSSITSPAIYLRTDAWGKEILSSPCEISRAYEERKKEGERLKSSLEGETLTLKLQTEEHAAGRDAGGLLANGQGKPKRGRWPRDGRRNKQSSEPDFDYEDDPDVIL